MENTTANNVDLAIDIISFTDGMFSYLSHEI